jgi:hypothetical protein
MLSDLVLFSIPLSCPPSKPFLVLFLCVPYCACSCGAGGDRERMGWIFNLSLGAGERGGRIKKNEIYEPGPLPYGANLTYAG